ncbi:restriction endonuclease subunit S [Vibrio coralliilyticus]|uniref:restriction endonuclease subunit S n=1 Tax=Vibrio coralliilyticus TaxID=190893 RepID=UPI0006910902|nr:restriction endonuclease subunit S [Vibrio coralliilyticus]
MNDLLPSNWVYESIEGLSAPHKGAIKIGPFGSALSKKEMVPSGIKVYGQEHVYKKDFSIGNYFITEEKYQKLKSCTLERGDVVVTMMGTVGASTVVPDDAEVGVMDSHLLRIQVDDKRVSSHLLSMQLRDSQDVKEQIRKMSQGGIMSGLNASIVKSIRVPLPTLSEQKKIAAILTSVDDVIGKTQAQIDKLKDLKTGMMQELLTRGVGVDGKPHTEFKDSPVGRIPKGWDCVLMEAICTKITDGEHQTPKRTTEGYYLLSARNVRDGYIDLTNVDYVEGDEFQRISKRVSPKQGDILISCSGSVGRVAVVPPKLEFSMVRSVAILQLNKDIVDPYFMAVQVAATAIQDQIEKSLSQQAQANLFQGAIKKLVVVVPTMPEQKRIASAVNSIANKIAKLQDGLKSKQSLKKALMQDLLTGKKRVKVDS